MFTTVVVLRPWVGRLRYGGPWSLRSTGTEYHPRLAEPKSPNIGPDGVYVLNKLLDDSDV